MKAALKNALKEYGLSISELARRAGVGRAHLSQVINNKPGRGGHTRRKVAPLLGPAVLRLLGWDASGKKLEAEWRPATEGMKGTDGNEWE